MTHMCQEAHLIEQGFANLHFIIDFEEGIGLTRQQVALI